MVNKLSDITVEKIQSAATKAAKSLGYESVKKKQLEVVSAIKQCVLTVDDGIEIGSVSVHLHEFFGGSRLPQQQHMLSVAYLGGGGVLWVL